MASYLKSISRPLKIGRCLSTTSRCEKSYSCKLVVVGGGAGGCSTAARFASKMKKDEIIIVEPSDKHYYQPMFTLVGGGMKDLSATWRPMSSVLPKNALWIRDHVSSFQPEKNTIKTKNGDDITYEYMIVALGITMHYDKIKGLMAALSQPDSNVCSNYSADYVNRTFESVKKFKSGNAVFTFPNTPVKCAGAPQKACYISEHYLTKSGKRDQANVIYKTSLPVIFSVKKYAASLMEVCKKRNINVNFREELIEVKPETKEAVFKNLDKPEVKSIEYEMLHVTPPMGPPAVLSTAPDLVDTAGYLNINKDTLQHLKFPNIFGIGDCTNLPTSKTAAAVAGQNGVLYHNLYSLMQQSSSQSQKYNGYTSCPLITSYSTCIMAEFDYNLEPLETFPIDQGKESYIMFLMKKDIMPIIYWNGLLKGIWSGPGAFRKVFHLGLK